MVWRIEVERRELFVERASGAEAFRKTFVQEARRVQEAEFSAGKSSSPRRGGLRFSVFRFRRYKIGWP